MLSVVLFLLCGVVRCFVCSDQFQQEQKENPERLEQSLLTSQMLQNSLGNSNMSTYYEDGGGSSSTFDSHGGGRQSQERSEDGLSESEGGSSQSKCSSVTSV